MLPWTFVLRLQATAAKQKAVQELADAKKKFVHMTRRRQAEHTAKVVIYIYFLMADGRSSAHHRLCVADNLMLSVTQLL